MRRRARDGDHRLAWQESRARELAGGRVPDPQAGVLVRRDHVASAGAEQGADDASVVYAERGDSVPGLGVENARIAGRRRREEQPPVRAEGCSREREELASGSEERLACGRVPYARRVVEARRDDPLPVAAELRASDVAVVAPKRRELLAGCGFPDPGGLVGARGDDTRAVGAEGCGGDGVAVDKRDGELLPVRALHTRAVPSKLAVTTRVPSGLSSASVTPRLCPRRTTDLARRSSRCQTRAVPSSLAVTIVPFRPKRTDVTASP